MFTERNYSKNNPIGLSGVNDQGLPLGFQDLTRMIYYRTHGSLLQKTAPSQIVYNRMMLSGDVLMSHLERRFDLYPAPGAGRALYF